MAFPSDTGQANTRDRLREGIRRHIRYSLGRTAGNQLSPGRLMKPVSLAVRELLIEMIAHEAEVVFFGADPPRSLQPLPLDDALPHRESQMVRIDGERERASGSVWLHDVGMGLDRRDVQIRGQEIDLAKATEIDKTRPIHLKSCYGGPARSCYTDD